jgi:hypothetical protein
MYSLSKKPIRCGLTEFHLRGRCDSDPYKTWDAIPPLMAQYLVSVADIGTHEEQGGEPVTRGVTKWHWNCWKTPLVIS